MFNKPRALNSAGQSGRMEKLESGTGAGNGTGTGT